MCCLRYIIPLSWGVPDVDVWISFDFGFGDAMKIATWAAAIAVAGGVAVLAAYWFVAVVGALFDAEEIPILIRIAVPAIIGGCAVLLLVAVLQRLRERKEEDLEGVDY